MTNSGKLIILAIFAVALTMAGAGWWYRYSSTHRAARFWGPEATRLLRDAPQLELIELRPATPSERQTPPPGAYWDFGGESQYVTVGRWMVSSARGLLHMRNALLEDRSFQWNRDQTPSHDQVRWRWILVFMSPQGGESVYLSTDCDYLMKDDFRVLSCQPIAAGLAEMVDEMAATAPTSPAAPPRQPAKPAR